MPHRRIIETLPSIEESGEHPVPPVPLEAQVTFLQPANLRGEAVEADAVSMRVLVNAPIEPGTRCIAIVHLAGGEETHERARVVWCKRSERGWLVSLELVA